MASRTPAIHTPREFGSDAGIRAARAAVDAIRIRLERLESALDASGEAQERQRRALLEAIGRVSLPVETGSTPPAETPRLLVAAAQALACSSRRAPPLSPAPRSAPPATKTWS